MELPTIFMRSNMDMTLDVIEDAPLASEFAKN